MPAFAASPCSHGDPTPASSCSSAPLLTQHAPAQMSGKMLSSYSDYLRLLPPEEQRKALGGGGGRWRRGWAWLAGPGVRVGVHTEALSLRTSTLVTSECVLISSPCWKRQQDWSGDIIAGGGGCNCVIPALVVFNVCGHTHDT